MVGWENWLVIKSCWHLTLVTFWLSSPLGQPLDWPRICRLAKKLSAGRETVSASKACWVLGLSSILAKQFSGQPSGRTRNYLGQSKLLHWWLTTTELIDDSTRPTTTSLADYLHEPTSVLAEEIARPTMLLDEEKSYHALFQCMHSSKRIRSHAFVLNNMCRQQMISFPICLSLNLRIKVQFCLFLLSLEIAKSNLPYTYTT